MEENEDLEPTSVEECRHKNDWPKWKDAIKAELNSFAKREVFRPIVHTPNDIKPVGWDINGYLCENEMRKLRL